VRLTSEKYGAKFPRPRDFNLPTRDIKCNFRTRRVCPSNVSEVPSHPGGFSSRRFLLSRKREGKKGGGKRRTNFFPYLPTNLSYFQKGDPHIDQTAREEPSIQSPVFGMPLERLTGRHKSRNVRQTQLFWITMSQINLSIYCSL
jgi:hypothetical protein